MDAWLDETRDAMDHTLHARTYSSAALIAKIDENDRLKPRCHVAVIGAGITGLTVAYHLISRGHTVQVFEKARVLGGRIRTESWTTDDQTVHAERGAMRIPRKHDLTRMWASVLGLTLAEFNNKMKVSVYYNEQSKQFKGMGEILSNAFPGLTDREKDTVQSEGIGSLWFDLVNRLIIEPLNRDERSVLFTLEQVTAESHPTLFDIEQVTLGGWLDKLVTSRELSEDGRRLIKYGLVLDGYESVSMLMFLREEVDDSFGGLQHISNDFNGHVGMSALTQGIAESKVPDGRKGTTSVGNAIQLNSLVTAFHLQEDGDGIVASVTCNDERQQHAFDRVVCTTMFTDLREGQVAFGDGVLSDAMRDSVEHLQYMHSFKALLRVHNRPWVDAPGTEGDTEGGAAPKGRQRAAVKRIGHGGQILNSRIGQAYLPGDDGVNRAGFILGMYRWGGPDLAEKVQAILGTSDEERKATLVRELTLSLPPGVGEKLRVHSFLDQEWYPAFQGIAPGDEARVRACVAHLQPPSERGRLYFAGEHLSPHPSWIQGSLWSALHTTATLLEDLSTYVPRRLASVRRPALAVTAVERRYTVARYLVARLMEVGVTHVFGVAGDYTFAFLDACEAAGVEVVPTCNELNAAYAADGFARVRGFGVCTGTFGVGALSLLSPVAGAWTESVPLLVVNGGPSRVNRLVNHHTDRLFHHASGSMTNDCDSFKQFTQVARVMDTESTVTTDIDTAIFLALKNKKPAYVEFPMDVWSVHCDPPTTALLPSQHVSFDHFLPSSMIHEVKSDVSDAIDALIIDIFKATHPLILAGVELHRFGLGSLFEELLEQLPCKYYTTLLGKSVISESHPRFAGLYEGSASVERVRVDVELDCDLLVAIGARLSDDVMAGTKLNLSKIAVLNSNKVSIGNNYYRVLSLRVFLEKMVERTKLLKFHAVHGRQRNEAYVLNPPSFNEHQEDGSVPLVESTEHSSFSDLSYSDLSHSAEAETRAASRPVTYEGFMCTLRTSPLMGLTTRVYVDTCNAQFISGDLPIHRAGGFIGAVAWGAIGQSLPSCLGGSLADGSAKPVVILGDGGLQMTCQALSTIARYHVPAVIILFTNHTYGIEQAIIDHGEIRNIKAYNHLAQWDYKGLFKSLTAPGTDDADVKFFEVCTANEARPVIRAAFDAQRSHCMAFVQVHVQPEDVPEAVKRVFGPGDPLAAKAEQRERWKERRRAKLLKVGRRLKSSNPFSHLRTTTDNQSKQQHMRDKGQQWVTAHGAGAGPVAHGPGAVASDHIRIGAGVLVGGYNVPEPAHEPVPRPEGVSTHPYPLAEQPHPGEAAVGYGERITAAGPGAVVTALVKHCCNTHPRFGVPFTGTAAVRLARRLAPSQEEIVSSIVSSLRTDALRDVLHTLSTSFLARVSGSEDYRRAVRHLQERMRSDAATLRLSTQSFRMPGGITTENLIAVLEGENLLPMSRSHLRVSADKHRKLVILCAHLDAVNWEDGDEAGAAAPGADDNASGSAVLLEAALRLSSSNVRFEHDIMFVWFSGEEQGLYGSTHFVSRLTQHDRQRIAGVVNMDMVGCRNGEVPGVLVEGADVLSDSLFQLLASCAAKHAPELRVFVSRTPFNSDHVPFLDSGVPAVLTIEHEDDLNANPHSARDTVETIDLQLMTAIARMNVAAVASLARPIPFQVRE